jgi:hypothetical protein
MGLRCFHKETGEEGLANVSKALCKCMRPCIDRSALHAWEEIMD